MSDATFIWYFAVIIVLYFALGCFQRLGWRRAKINSEAAADADGYETEAIRFEGWRIQCERAQVVAARQGWQSSDVDLSRRFRSSVCFVPGPDCTTSKSAFLQSLVATGLIRKIQMPGLKEQTN